MLSSSLALLINHGHSYPKVGLAWHPARFPVVAYRAKLRVWKLIMLISPAKFLISNRLQGPTEADRYGKPFARLRPASRLDRGTPARSVEIMIVKIALI